MNSHSTTSSIISSHFVRLEFVKDDNNTVTGSRFSIFLSLVHEGWPNNLLCYKIHVLVTQKRNNGVSVNNDRLLIEGLEFVPTILSLSMWETWFRPFISQEILPAKSHAVGLCSPQQYKVPSYSSIPWINLFLKSVAAVVQFYFMFHY